MLPNFVHNNNAHYIFQTSNQWVKTYLKTHPRTSVFLCCFFFFNLKEENKDKKNLISACRVKSLGQKMFCPSDLPEGLCLSLGKLREASLWFSGVLVFTSVFIYMQSVVNPPLHWKEDREGTSMYADNSSQMCFSGIILFSSREEREYKEYCDIWTGVLFESPQKFQFYINEFSP